MYVYDYRCVSIISQQIFQIEIMTYLELVNKHYLSFVYKLKYTQHIKSTIVKSVTPGAA